MLGDSPDPKKEGVVVHPQTRLADAIRTMREHRVLRADPKTDCHRSAVLKAMMPEAS
jgi:CBS domain-containing protein